VQFQIVGLPDFMNPSKQAEEATEKPKPWEKPSEKPWEKPRQAKQPQ
jgi:hypothetical protein